MLARRLIGTVALLTAIGGTAVLTACGGSTTTDTGSPAGSAAPGTSEGGGSSYAIVPAAQVTAGLAEVRKLAATAKATLGTDQAGAQRTVKGMYDKWYEFEGTVRK